MRVGVAWSIRREGLHGYVPTAALQLLGLCRVLLMLGSGRCVCVFVERVDTLVRWVSLPCRRAVTG